LRRAEADEFQKLPKLVVAALNVTDDVVTHRCPRVKAAPLAASLTS
jgi:hypothetical protein